MAFEPPRRSHGVFSDVFNFLLHKPKYKTLIKFKTLGEREDYSYSIMQRLGVQVTDYRILNIHKIGVNAPPHHVFEELLKWDGDSVCWPNFIAKVIQPDFQLEHIMLYLFGWTKVPQWIRKSIIGRNLIPLFNMDIINIKRVPDTIGADNARYLLYNCSGGYPIGVFSLYVRSSIEERNEIEQSQLFLMVGFNFYGRENWSKQKLVNKAWESVHDRVTSNVLNKLKQLSEWRFEKIRNG